MKQGGLSERYLKKAVFDKMSGKGSDMAAYPGIGMDYSASTIPTEKGLKESGTVQVDKDFAEPGYGLITADGSGETPAIAFYKALNNFSCSLGSCSGCRILMVLPETVKESEICGYMEQFADLAEQEKIQILGGDSKVISSISKPYFHVVMLGQSNRALEMDRKNIKPGAFIVCAGEAGILGTNLLLAEKEAMLKERFSASFLGQAVYPQKSCSIRPVMELIRQDDLAVNCRIHYAHDVSEKGIYGALWQLGEWMKKGILVENSAISIKQETIEICEVTDRNPYLIDGTGCVLFVCEKGRELVYALGKQGIPASVIGQVTGEKERLVRITDKDIRTLEPC